MKTRILYVDDEPNLQQSLHRMLRTRRQGHVPFWRESESDTLELLVAENGWRALELLRAQPVDVILLDLMMPEMNGYQVLEYLKADDALRHIPVIVISGLDEIESVVKCIEMGAEDYLSKPFNPVLLHARVGACLEKKRLYDREQACLRQLQAFNQTLEQRVQDTTSTIEDYAYRLERRLREMEAMVEVTLALNSVMDVDRLLEMIMDTSKEVAHAGASSLLLLDPDTGKLRFHVARGTAGQALQSATVNLGQGIAGWVAQSGEPLLIPDAYQDDRFDPSYDQRTGFRTRSILTVPLKVKDEVRGVLQVMNKVGEETFDEHDLNLFLSFAGQVGVALENARLYERTRSMAENLRQALEHERRLSIENQKMGAYLPKQVVDEISRNREQTLALGGRTVWLTVLFADILGFTRLSEMMDPQQVVGFLNVYMTAMTAIIETEGGIIDKFIGDGIMAIFPPQDEADNHALRAVRSGIRMQQKLAQLRADWEIEQPELAGLQIRVGINTGEVVAGNIGSETRMDYTVVGDNVNVAARLESVCGPGEVCMSESTYLEVWEAVPATKLESIRVKNRVQPVQIYAVRVPAPNGDGATLTETTEEPVGSWCIDIDE